jgi:hypothetical protein
MIGWAREIENFGSLNPGLLNVRIDTQWISGEHNEVRIFTRFQ